MSSEPQLFRVDPESGESERIEEVDFRSLGFLERQHIQEWVAANPGILGEDLLIVGKECSGFDLTNERLDLLAVDSDGKLVIIELKRDDTGADAHWQAIKYASYLHRADASEIISMMVDHGNISPEEATTELLQHLGADDLNALNNDQRIILASHKFAPEVTSAVLWLNEKAPGENLITCVKLTPYRDANTGSLYVQASTIIPVPGKESYIIGIGRDSRPTATRGTNTLSSKLRATFARNRTDDVTQFLKKVGLLTLRELPDETRPDQRSRWAGDANNFRYYHFWYKRPPWSNWGLSYRVNLRPEDESSSWRADVEFKHARGVLQSNLAGVSLHPDQRLDSDGIRVSMGSGTLNDEFAERIAEMARQFIEQITPIVDDLENENSEE